MSGLENLKKRLDYQGGSSVESRMEKNRERTLKRALFNSYQAETIVLPDQREFKCAINKSKLTEDYDIKTFCIPYEDICLNAKKNGKTSQNLQFTNVYAGEVIHWKETDTDWIIYLQSIQETAYFRSLIKRCRYDIDVEGTKYKVYVKGPTVSSIDWNIKSVIYNDLNYDLQMTITKDERTEAFFHRHTKVKLLDKNWKVAATDSVSTEGVIDVYLDEDYSNSIEDAIKEEEKEKVTPQETLPDYTPVIEGDFDVYPYSQHIQTIKNLEGGTWSLNVTKKAEIGQQDEHSVTVNVLTGRSGFFDLIYTKPNGDTVTQRITILPF